MLNATFPVTEEGLNLLFLGAHCDDIEIGCGGTLLKLIDHYEINQINWVVFSSDEKRKEEAFSSATQFLESITNAEIKILEYKDGYLPSVWSKIKDEFKKLEEDFSPDIVFTHFKDGLHQDHQIVNELTRNTFRNHLIFEYEIPPYDGDLGNPNLFVPLAEKYIRQKKKIIFDSYENQLDEPWFDETLLTSIMRIRGVESVSGLKFAEAFYSRKMTL